MAKVLLIDDDAQFRRYVATLLKRSKHEVIEAADGQQGIAALKSHDIDLMLTDLIMPGMEGVETICEVRKLRPRLKIIAMSGNPSSITTYLPAVQKLGADMTLTKPFAPEQLLAALESLIPRA